MRPVRSTWVLGTLAAIASWEVTLSVPRPGLDPSFEGASYMAFRRGMEYGSEIVFTYGPLALFNEASLWYADLGVLVLLFSSALWIALATSLVWALRRTVNAGAAWILTVLVLIAAPLTDVAVALAAVWCLIALSPRAPNFAQPLVLFGGAALGAIETLVQLRSGPVILAICAITLLARDGSRRQMPIFIGCSALVFSLLWFASGQGIANLPDFVRISAQITSGYSEAMGDPGPAGLYLSASLLIGATLVAAAALSSTSGRPRLAAAAVVALAGFAVFKEAFVRADLYHRPIFFATAAVLGTAMAFGQRRLLAIAAVSGLAAVSVVSLPPNLASYFSPIPHARKAVDQVRIMLSPARRRVLRSYGRELLRSTYRLEPATLRLLRGKTVHVDPWETAVVWAYGLNWDPLPVFQDYNAYTAALDRLNSDALRSPGGPQRLLRENTRLVDPERLSGIDSRLPAWDPPGKSIAMFCNYLPLQTTDRWQVLGKVPNRCETPQLLTSIPTRYGKTVRIPPAKRGGVLYAKLDGAGVSGLERVRTMLYRARPRFVVVNGTVTYRLVPGTAADGLLLDASRNVDYPAPFNLVPGARTLAFTGRAGNLRVDLYHLPVRPPTMPQSPDTARRKAQPTAAHALQPLSG